MKGFIVIVMVVLLLPTMADAQTIRKSWRELTSSERTAYVNKINQLYNNGAANNIWMKYVNDHAAKGQHGNDFFAPWHREFLYYMEKEMGMPLVFWDWAYNKGGLIEWSDNSPMFKDANGGVVGLFQRNLSIPITRQLTLGTAGGPTETGLNELLNHAWDEGPSTGFHRIIEEQYHPAGHAQIGGTMAPIPTSPTDPVFYLHHSMVDNWFQQWVEGHWDGSNLMSTTPVATITGKPSIDMNTHIDSRKLKVWYAYDHGVAVYNYTVSGTEVYKYTTGDIYSWTFNIPSGTSCEFNTDNSYLIHLYQGFHAAQGSKFHASRTDIAADGRVAVGEALNDEWVNTTPATLTEGQTHTMSLYPNPSQDGTFSIQFIKNDFYAHCGESGDSDLEKNLNLEVLGLNGAAVIGQKISKRDLLLSKFSIKQKGMFLVRLKTEKGEAYTEKLLIE